MKKTMYLTPEGTRDLLFEECLARREAEGRLSELFTLRGFSEVMTPGIEFFDVFGGGIIPAGNMYKLTDNKGRLLVMRPDTTAPVARLTAARLRQAELPVRLFYIQDVFRLNHGLSGHSDQICQAGAELIGAPGEKADLEVIGLAADALGRFTEDFRIEIGHIGFFRSLIGELDVDGDVKEDIRGHIELKNYAALSEALDALPPSPGLDAIRRLPRLFGGEEVLREAEGYCRAPETKAALESLSRLYRQLTALGLGDRVMIDLGLLHRHEYYTGTLFCGYMEGSGEAVVSGGRYDNLHSRFGEGRPATGFGINVDALTGRMLGNGEAGPPMPPDVLVHAEVGQEAAGLLKVKELTEEGLICEFSVFDGLKEALDYAGKKNIGNVFLATGDGIEVYEI